MTHLNHQTNGASLEDCHTNFFALTELCGIKWRKLTWGECGFSSAEPLEDPVLASYARCLSHDILCVWRRVVAPAGGQGGGGGGGGGGATHQHHGHHAAQGAPHHQHFDGLGLPPHAHAPPSTHPPLSLHAAKELWIFWYGEEPDLSNLVAPELIAAEGEQGSWESGLSYECRSLLFKALHNLIERCLLSRDFVRLGKWFIQPYEGSEKMIGASTHFSFSFAFFVHGESTVCASIDVRTHPLVRSLSWQHLQQAQASSSGIPVILAPYGMAGTLTGQVYKSTDVQVQRHLEDWRQFFPLGPKCSSRDGGGEESALPPAVEVLVGGTKMRYPRCYVLVTDMDDPSAAPNRATLGLSPAAAADAVLRSVSLPATTAPADTSTPPPPPSHQSPGPAACLTENVWQDNALNPTQHEQHEQASPATGLWEFADPTRKAPCNCSKYKKASGAKQIALIKGGANSSGGMKTLKGEKNEKGVRGCGRGGVTPFHRRPPLGEEAPCPLEVAVPLSRLAGSGTPSGGPPSYPRGQSMTPNPLPNLHSGGGLNDSLPVPSVGSPASAAPSPLPNPHSQPASVPPADPTMPTLSPHPPTSTGGQPQPATPLESQDKITPAATPSDLNGPKSVSSVSNQVFSPYPTTSSVEPATKAVDSVGGSQGPASAHSTAPSHPTTTMQEVPLLKRPILTSKEYENILMEEEQPLKLLYDYSAIDAWLNHPVKRFKPCESKSGDPSRHSAYTRRMSPSDLYSSHQHAASPPNGMSQPFMRQEIKQEPGCGMMMEVESVQLSKRSDPYEFDDDMAAPSVSMEGFKRTNSLKEEDRKSGNSIGPFDPVNANGPTNKVPNSLFTNEGLQPSYRDLDQIFDNDDEASCDEALQVQTPPGSNKPAGLSDDTASTSLLVKPPRGSGGNTSLNSCGGSGILRPEELSKMFPTPPSMEHNPIASPCGHLSDGALGELTESLSVTCSTRFKQEIYPNMGSPQEENIEDWSYVFRPPTIYRFVGSSKYAPLTNLPSQSLPPVNLPTNCVYKPSWQYPPVQQVSEKSASSSHSNNIPVSSNAGTNSRPNSVSSNPHTTQVSHPHHPHPHHTQLPHPRAISPAGPFPPSPMTLVAMSSGGLPVHMQSQFRGGGVRTPCPPPPPYELPSPATSTASSYLNKNLNSVEPVPTPIMARAPEANSLVVNILLSDTALNIFRDHNFDSCTLCVCNAGLKVVGNIRGADAGIYLPDPPSQPPATSLPYPPTSPFLSVGSIGMGGPPPPYGMMGSSPGHHGGTSVMNGAAEEDPIRCSCGFSAVVNRRLSHRSGLFYEDEQEITGIAEDPSERRKGSIMAYLLSSSEKSGTENGGASDLVDQVPQNVIELVREQCVIVQSSSNSLYRASKQFRGSSGPAVPYGTTVNVLEFTDSNEVTCMALEQGRQALLESTTVAMCKVEEMQQRQQMMQNSGKGANVPCVHRWPYLRAMGPQCNQDIVRVMKTLQPLLQEAIQKKCTTRLWEAPYTVSGPLTWRKFHRLAGRGTNDRCEPQPIPSLMVGYDKDWLSLSPYAIQYWEKLLLEPYSYARDIAFVVVAPDNDFVLQKVRTFFKELSATYEVCRLGRHCPITKHWKDGILRVGKNTAHTMKEPVDEWFSLLGDTSTTNMLKLYAQVCRHHLVNLFTQVPLDKTLLDPPENAQLSRSCVERPMPSPMPPPSTPENNQGQIPDKAPSTPKSDHDSDTGSGARDPLLSGGSVGGSGDCSHDDDDSDPPAIVVYIVDPFTIGRDSPDLQRLSCLGLLRCFIAVQSNVPENMRNNITVQIISLESIVELGKMGDHIKHNDQMRAQAFSVFSQCRRLLTHTSNIKSLTGFGTAAMADLFLKKKDEKNRAPYRLYTPPYVLAPVKEKAESNESFGQSSGEQCSVLYVSYCLSEDQRWLLTAATDERGEIYETSVINIDIPNRSRRRKASARRVGLQKLMDFILSVMSQSVQSWRLVVGRIGRIGHGELKGWSWLLSRKSLLKASKHLKEICNQCSLMYPNNVPCVLSACLVSLEPDSALRLMPDQFTPDERFSQASVNCQLSTPQDVSCTHILVFPTSATTQSSQTAFQEQHINGPDLGDDELFSALNDDMPEGIEEMQDFNDIFTWPETGPGGVQSPTGSPHRDSPSQPGSPSCGMGGTSDQHSPFPCNASSRGGANMGIDTQEEVGTLHQQPLALGYFVSTAPTGRMPRWFWASCPHLENVCPAFLKNALHLHSPAIQQNSDDILQQQSAVTVHPLDSQYTTDVLRYVLEGYNALSWLALDSNTRDRLSCLPVHIQALMQLYHTTSALV
ncbi:mediator of RNA polymerase II transcription subunit 13 [Schistocerca americana]|uniref:mediator of RNA polymerase II transcription subunit 13 n=1 Tax=Schistocerca americana TaxID=7009 RepID=UPI001F4FCFD4|nr:mediator of RNA polymerase II transcription subunit 13 [Schistocerca americana]